MRGLTLSAVLLVSGLAHAAAPRVRISVGPVAPGLTASPLVAAPLSLPVPAAPAAPMLAAPSLTPLSAPAVAAPQVTPSATMNAAAPLAPKAEHASAREGEGQVFWRQALAEAASPAVAAEAAGAWQARLPAAVVETGAETERLLSERKKGTKISRELATGDTKTITEYSGVPSRVEELKDYGRVYRHYIRSEADLKSILGSGMLKAGQVSYVEFTGSSRAYIKDIYPDVHGVFFTTPETKSGEPRVMNESVPHWIDFRIPPGVRAVSLDGTDVLMLPIDRGAFVPVVIVGSSAP